MAEVTVIGDNGSQHLEVRLTNYECQSSYHAVQCALPYTEEGAHGTDQHPQFLLKESIESPDIRYDNYECTKHAYTDKYLSGFTRSLYCPDNCEWAQMGVDFVVSLTLSYRE